MPTWTIAFGVTAIALMVAIPATTDLAFRSGWFERSTQTSRARRDRRPTHGGLLVAAALAIGAGATGTGGPALRATIAVAVLAVVAGHRAERDRGPVWAVPAGWIATALVVPLLGVRAELTGTGWVDVVVTAICIVALTGGLDAVDHTDVTASLVAGLAAGSLLAVAVHADDQLAPLAGVLAGACVGLVAHGWPPAAVRIGAIGPMVLGPTLGIVAVEAEPSVAAPRSALVPVLVLALVGALAVLPRIDRRLRSRGVAPHLAIGAAALAGAIAGAALERGELEPVAAVIVAVVPAALVLLVGRIVRPARPAFEVAVLRRRRRRVLWSSAIGLLLVVGGVSAVSLWSAKDAMQRGRVDALAALDAARAGDLEVAQARFDSAARAFADAKSSLDNPAVRLGGLIPVVAPNLRAARALADVGSDLATTAVAVADRAGADDLRIEDGQFPIERARSVSEDLAEALGTLHSSIATLDRVDSPLLVNVVGDATRDVREEVADVTSSLEVAAEATRLLPGLLGADGEQRWIVAIMSTSELRGAGGLLGDFAEVRLLDGGVEQVRPFAASAVNAATDKAEQAAALPEIYAEQYGGYGVDRFWQNLSATPDAVTMSTAIADAYPLTDGGGPVDGVVAIDAIGLAGILQLTGPVDVPLWPEPVTADNAVQVLLYDHYQRLDGAARDRFQGLVVTAVVDAMTSRSLPGPSVLAATLAPAVAGGHLRLWSDDPAAEQLFARIDAAGSLPPQTGDDFVQLITQNGSEAKIDWFLRRSLAYEVSVDPSTGALLGSATVSLTNEAPASGVSSYIIGGDAGGPTRPGVNRMVVTLLTPHVPLGATDEAGAELPLNLGREASGLYAASVVVELAPGATTAIRFDLQGAVAPADRYRLLVGHQPTRRPDQVSVRLRTTGGWSIESPPDGAASYEDDAQSTFAATLREP